MPEFVQENSHSLIMHHALAARTNTPPKPPDSDRTVFNLKNKEGAQGLL